MGWLGGASGFTGWAAQSSNKFESQELTHAPLAITFSMASWRVFASHGIMLWTCWLQKRLSGLLHTPSVCSSAFICCLSVTLSAFARMASPEKATLMFFLSGPWQILESGFLHESKFQVFK